MTDAPAGTEAEHTPEAIRQRLARGPARSYLRDVVYGAVDGVVTTFAVVAGVAGAGLDAEIVVILGVANLVADGFSMAASNFLGVRSEQQRHQRLRRQEEHEVAVMPAGEREEVRQLLAGWDLHGGLLDRVVDAICADRDRWVELMMRFEHGVSPSPARPGRAAVATFAAFIVAGAVPLAPFGVDLLPGAAVASAFAWSTVMTAAAFFVVGAAKGVVVARSWWRSGFETLVVGGAAAALAYAVGTALGGLA
jgi:VIT1/CCC1 family predicted Fe2+/Mn2+ transporter